MATTPEMFGPYVVYEQLGMGGMASVHVAESRTAHGPRKRLALKRLHPHAAADPSLVEAFVEEARLDARLDHPNITKAFDFGEVDGVHYIAMELVVGPTLSQLLRQCHAAIGHIPVPIVLHILVDVCEALDYAHTLADERGQPLHIVHRDVAPTNIIIARDGAVKLIDFGVAKAATSLVKTQTGFVKGKVAYLPPEYLTTGKLDARADLWSLGVVAYELLACDRLFDGANDFETLQQIRGQPIEPLSRRNSDVSRSLEAIVMTALERDPSHRWQSAAAMRNALRGEIAERGAHITNGQVISWVEWAFSQKPANDERSGVSELIAMLDKPEHATITLEPDPDTSVGRPTVTLNRRLEEPKLPIAPSHRRVRWWLVALLIAVAAAAVGYELDLYQRVRRVVRAPTTSVMTNRISIG